VGKLVRRLGSEVVEKIKARGDLAKARCETRFIPRAVRIDSTVIEADVRSRGEPSNP
jgi:hypothetical protein